MSSNTAPAWESRELGDICSFRAGIAFKTDRQGKQDGKFPFIKVSDMSRVENVRYITGAANWVDDDDVSALKGKPFQENTIVFAKIGEALKANRFRVLTGDTFIDNNMMGATPNTEKVDPVFLFYLLHELRLPALATGSALPYLRAGDLKQIRVLLPARNEQRSIAWILGALDDKIDNHRRIAETLEQIAATLFKARFVDFVDHGDLIESEVGQIPRGWSPGRLSDISVVHREPAEGGSGLPYIGLDAMPRASTVLMDWKTENAPAGQSMKFAEGDILFGKLRPYFRKVGVAPLDGRCSAEILVLRPDDPDYYGFLLGHVSSQPFIEHCGAISRGTRMPRAEWKDAGTFPVAVPPKAIAAELSAVVVPMYAQIRSLIHQSRTLDEIRDSLMSRLISGELRALPADGAGEEAA